MRCARSSAWVKSAVFAGGLLVAAAGLAPGAVAQEKYDRLFVFGDSYADVDLAKVPLPPPLPPGLWTVYPIPLAENLQGLQLIDYAVGGAQTTNLPSQLSDFLGSPTNTIGPRDLVTINIGGNDGIGRVIAGAITSANAEAEAKISADNATVFIDDLVKAGAQTFVIGGFSGLSGLPIIVGDDKKAAGDLFGQTYFNLTQQNLLPLAESGVRFFMLDEHRLGQQVSADPSKYGLIATEVGGVKGSQCPLQPGQGSLPAPLSWICGGRIDSPDQKKYFLGPDGLHLTEAGFKLVADYMAKIVMAPDTIAVQPGIVMSTTSAFTGSVLGRLDAMRDARDRAAFRTSIGTDGTMGLGYGGGKRARPEGPSSRLTAYSIGTFAGGSRDDTFEVSGFDYDARSGTVGLEYSASRNLIVGLAGNITNTGADINSDADVDIDTLQAAAYASYATRQVFLEGLVSYGSHDLDLSRLAVLPGDTIRSSTDASSLAAAARGGYLFDFGSLRAGPIAGVTYIHSRVDGYTEDGDELLTFNVERQTLESLTGNLGIQFRGVFLSGGNLISPFLNVSLEHQFGDDARTFTSSLTQAPLLPIPTTVPNFDTRTYGRVEGGVLFGLGSQMSATVNASSTFARDEGNDWRISTGLSFRF